jgi:rapamycin-insensitive companion of mTOR
MKIEPWIRASADVQTSHLPKLAGLEEEIMSCVARLSNFVLAAKAMNNLKRYAFPFSCTCEYTQLKDG